MFFLLHLPLSFSFSHFPSLPLALSFPLDRRALMTSSRSDQIRVRARWPIPLSHNSPHFLPTLAQTSSHVLPLALCSVSFR
ncbi:hypothetical protein IE53DRAFT_260261 [Violaceomyces palustris]|uniref:Uncharacterized protein n=1 Tax=Violaceomyces palustris TaxID=1673888 RepID=A0ACD0NN96_9BASI|nr:hypothetical protein IE53DRAFT_260261 [Violaceomyces palustris]